MGVISVNELGQRSASQDKERTTYTHVYQVIVSDVADDAATVLASPNVPPLFSRLASDLTAVCISRSVSQVDRLKYEVTVEFDTSQDEEENPLDRAADINWGSSTDEEIVEEDVDGNAILNSAGDPFDPPPTRKASASTLTITRNEASYDGTLDYLYSKTVNDDAFFGFPAGSFLIDSITASSQEENGFQFWSVTYTFLLNPNGWQLELLDQGMRRLDGGERVPILINGREITDPVPLDGAGDVLDPADPAVFIDADRYEEVDFGELGLE